MFMDLICIKIIPTNVANKYIKYIKPNQNYSIK